MKPEGAVRASSPGCREYEGVDPMGRGRAKAKQTKVARQLKYSTPDTDLEALQRELSGDGDSPSPHDSEFEGDEFGAYAGDETDSGRH